MIVQCDVATDVQQWPTAEKVGDMHSIVQRRKSQEKKANYAANTEYAVENSSRHLNMEVRHLQFRENIRISYVIKAILSNRCIVY